jgi:serine/threonine protein phosphatase PrpC
MVNEDTILASRPVFAVADGMGGAAGGEVASQVALAKLQALVANDERLTMETLVDAVQAANRAVYERALDDLHLRGMGTTVTGVALAEHDGEACLVVVNVGDSRTYVVHEGHLLQITRDHTLVEELVEAGEITADEAKSHPRRHIITRALGVEPMVDVDAWEAAPQPGDRYLVCSDGLFNEIDDDLIAAVLTSTTEPQEAADVLVDMANEAGGHDNVSVIVLDVTSEDGRDHGPQVVPEAPAEDTGPAPATGLVRPPVGIASPGATEPLGGWLEDSSPTAVLPVPPPTSPPDPGPPQARHVPWYRRITGKTVAFVLAVLAILAIAWGAITYYGRQGYYVGFAGDQVAVYKGPKGGVLWVKPTVDATYPLHRRDLSRIWQQRLDETITFTSRGAADNWFATLAQNPVAVPSLATTTTTPAGATTATPPTARPATTVRPSPATTRPATRPSAAP